MNREEKREIRSQINDIFERECYGCEHHKNGLESFQYCLKVCPVAKTMQSLSSKLSQKVVEEGAFITGKWSPNEVSYLINHEKHFDTKHLSERLNRSPEQIWAKLYRLRKEKKKTEEEARFAVRS